MRFSDKSLAVIFGALGLLFFALTLNFPAFPGQRFGPALFPRILATLLVASSLVMFFRRPRADVPDTLISWSPDMRAPGRIVNFLAIPVAVLVYLLAADRLGFAPTAFAMIFGLMLLFKVRWWKALLVALVATALVAWFFGTLMRVPLPRGLFLQLLEGG